MVVLGIYGGPRGVGGYFLILNPEAGVHGAGAEPARPGAARHLVA